MKIATQGDPRAPLILLLLLGIQISLLLLALAGPQGLLWFWMAVSLLSLLLASRDQSARSSASPAREDAPRMLQPEEQPAAIRECMDVRIALAEGAVRIFRGPLKVRPKELLARLRPTLGTETTPFLQQDDRLGAAVILVPDARDGTHERPHARRSPLLNALLLGLTIITTTWAGASHYGVDLAKEPERFAVGLPYSLALLAILGVHELGHYVTAKRNGIRVSLPYFIPAPFALGTFGAFIQMRSLPENRQASFDVAAAGPIAGLVLAVPTLLIGLGYSEAAPLESLTGRGSRTGIALPSSLLLSLFATLSLGGEVALDQAIRLSPLAFAGWLGMFVTALNLMPIGQLDGGHIARAIFGSPLGMLIGRLTAWALLMLALFAWPNLLVWALIAFLLSGPATPPLDDITPISPGRRALGYAIFALLALIIAPVPRALL